MGGGRKYVQEKYVLDERVEAAAAVQESLSFISFQITPLTSLYPTCCIH